MSGRRGALRLWPVAALLCLCMAALHSPHACAAAGLDDVPADASHVFHIIAHSHCDPGWLNTFEGYYMADVRGIFDSVLAALQRDPTRRFVWSETSYFARWWEVTSQQQRAAFRRVLAAGQFEFVNGGWSQHDEACPDPLSMVQQMTTGHQYLLQQFGLVPRVAWQIDPFGHSAVTPTLFRLMGMQALVINRIHFTVKDYFKEQKHMEFIWRGVDGGLGNATDMLTHVLHTHYSAPQGFDWEEYAQAVDDNSVAGRASQLVNALKGRAGAYRHRHLLVPFGDDFKFRNAELQFSNMGRLVSYIQQHSQQLGNVWIRFSTLSDYFAAAAAEGQFPSLQGDFMPYADNEQSYWTGYYTTRPLLKDKSRILGSLLRSAELLHTLVRSHGGSQYDSAGELVPADYWEVQFSALQTAREETALFLHHDAITGTSRSNVVADYLDRMGRAAQKLQLMMANMLQHLITKHSHRTPLLTHSLHTIDIADTRQAQQAVDAAGVRPLYAPVVLFNSLAWHRDQLVSVKVSTRHVSVEDHNGQPVPAQVDMEWESLTATQPLQSVFVVHFVASLPPLATRTYFLHLSPTPHATTLTEQSITTIYSPRNRAGGSSEAVQSRYIEYSDSANADIALSNAILTLHFSPSSGLLSSVDDVEHGRNTSLRQQFEVYRTSQSGAYLFRPNPESSQPLFTGDLPSSSVIRVTRGRLVSRLAVAHHRFDVVYALQAHSARSLALAPSFTMTATASADGNQEVTLATYTDLDNRDTFYTHNGWQFMRRIKTNGPLPAQFYPTVAALRLQDEAEESSIGSSPSRRLSVVTSHTCAGSVPQAGKVELLIHRHLNQDDGRGLAEGVADSSRQEITLTFSLQSVDRVQRGLPTSAVHFDDELSFSRHVLHVQHPALTFILQRRDSAQPPPGFHEFASLAASPATLFAHTIEWKATQLTSVEPMTRPLPSTVHLHSLMARDAVTDEIALRLQHVGVDIVQASDEPSDAAASAHSTVSLDLTDHFPAAVRLSEMRRVGITLNHRRPWAGSTQHTHSGGSDADSLHPGWQFRADESTDVMDTLLLRKFLATRQQRGGGGDNQNSQEQGVFISEAALRGEQDKKRRAEEEQQSQQRQPAHRRLMHAQPALDAYAAQVNDSSARRLLSSEGAAEWSMLSLPVVRISSNQLHAYILHIEADDDETTQRADRDPHAGRVRQHTAKHSRPPATPTTRTDRKHTDPQPPSEQTRLVQPQPPSGVDVEEGGGAAVPGAMSVIPSRVEYLLILVVCVLAVLFFALALGLIPSKAIGRAWHAVLGDQPPPQHSNGRSAAQPHSLPSRLYARLYALEHWAVRGVHRMRAYVLHARYARTGPRSSATAI